MTEAAAVLLSAAHVAFMQRGISISLGSCGADHVPNLSRGIGCRIDGDRRRLTVFVSAAQSAALLADIRANGLIAAVFSEPSTHRTLQVKGRDGAIAALDDGDLRRIAFYREAFLLEISALGFNPTIARSLLHCPDDDITAVAFTVAEAYTQTPGPDAGAPLRADW
ncbi:hypothetical protein [Methylogaea oryzae]|uniref:Uncharacterized protein n=1 Tax=Methylogaea oryzae TaxID=1295382 RepID=A0A8D4VQ60_9GAMM|nr:hypothetical protein [Methylogaea oryzae]BBL70617.1 hypothetical protein MoryE10_12230 [Methylogaea oryzae]